MSRCSACGDKTTLETEVSHHYSCWVKAKMSTQENLPAPVREGEQITPYGQTEYIQPTTATPYSPPTL